LYVAAMRLDALETKLLRSIFYKVPFCI